MNLTIAANQLLVDATKLEGSTFEKLMSELEYDCTSIKHHMANMSSYETANFAKRQQWDLNQYKLSTDAAEGFMKRNVALHMFDRPGRYYAEYHSSINAFANAYSLDINKISVVSVTNWAAPSLLSSQDL